MSGLEGGARAGGSSSRSGNVSLGLSIAAIVVALGAVGIGWAIPGPAGVPGPPGPRGNGTIMANGGIERLTQVTSTCARSVGSEVSITVPGPGTIVATAKVWVALEHSGGATDQIVVTVNATTNCTRDLWAGDALASFSLPADYYYYNVPVVRPFGVAAAGTYTYGVNGVMLQGASAGDGIHKSILVLVYYPS